VRYEFASRQWLAALHGIITERAERERAAKPKLSMSICEVFTNAPAHLAGEGSRIVWSCVVEGNDIDFRITERDDVRVKVVVPYDKVLPLGRYDTRGDPARAAELASLVDALRANGDMQTIGEHRADPQAISSVHDAIARLTE
jgi:hypothetical protein